MSRGHSLARYGDSIKVTVRGSRKFRKNDRPSNGYDEFLELLGRPVGRGFKVKSVITPLDEIPTAPIFL